MKKNMYLIAAFAILILGVSTFWWATSVASPSNAMIAIAVSSLFLGSVASMGLLWRYVWGLEVEKVSTRTDNGAPDPVATRQWVEKHVRKANVRAALPAQVETADTYEGHITFRGKSYKIKIEKNDLYKMGEIKGGVDHRLAKLTGEIWVGGRHVKETREATNIAEVVADIQTNLNGYQHLEGQLQLQIRTQVYRFVSEDDVKKRGWPAALRGNVKQWIASFPTDFQIEQI